MGVYGLFSSLSGGTFPYVRGTPVLIRPFRVPKRMRRKPQGGLPRLGVTLPKFFQKGRPERVHFVAKKKLKLRSDLIFQLVNFRGVCIHIYLYIHNLGKTIRFVLGKHLFFARCSRKPPLKLIYISYTWQNFWFLVDLSS